MTHAPGLVVVPPGEGRRITALGNLHLKKAESADTGGAWALVEQRVTGSNPPLHVHQREDEAFYILRGGLRVTIGGEIFEARAGAFVLAPRGVPHTFARLPGEDPHLLVLVSPAGFESMFDDIAVLPAAEQQNPAALAEVAAKYGVEILGPPPQ